MNNTGPRGTRQVRYPARNRNVPSHLRTNWTPSRSRPSPVIRNSRNSQRREQEQVLLERVVMELLRAEQRRNIHERDMERSVLDIERRRTEASERLLEIVERVSTVLIEFMRSRNPNPDASS